MARFGSNLSIYIGIVVSVSLGLQLANHIMSSGVGTELTFTEFFTIPENLFYVLLRVSLCMSFWIMNGVNNRTYLVLWILGDAAGALVYWNGLQLFLYEQKNIYILNVLAVISIMPLYCFCRYRILLLLSLYSFIQKVSLFKTWAVKHQKQLTITKVTTTLDRWLEMVVTIELAFAVLFSGASLYFQLLPGESLNQHFSSHNWPDFFAYQITVLELWNLLFCAVLLKVAIDDRQDPDAFISVSKSVKKRVLQKHNKK